MLDLTDFGSLQFREEDFAEVPPVDLDGATIPDAMPEKWERLMRGNPKAQELWNATNYPTSYPSASEHAFALMWLAGYLGLDKSESAGLHVAHYDRHGQKEKGIRKVKYALRAWESGRREAEARGAGSGDGQPPEREPGESIPVDATTGAKDGESITLLSQGAEEFLSGEIKPIEWAIEDIWPIGNNGPIGGPEKTGKTWLAHEMVLSLATATPFLGKYRVKHPYRVLYWEEEDSKDRTKRRGRQLLAGRNRPTVSSEQLRYLVGHGLKIDQSEGKRRIRHEIESFKPDFVVVGNLREVHGKDENRPEMAQVRDAFRTLSREFGCAFILIHHFRKAQADQSKRGSQMLAGSGVWGAWADAWMYVTPGGSEDAALVEVGSKDAPGVGKLVVHRRDVTECEPLAEDEDGRKVWPVVLGEVERKARTDESRDEVRKAGEALYESTKAPITIEQIAAKTSVKERTVRDRVRELVESGAWQEVDLPRNRKGYVTTTAQTLL